ncbi:hypothetical protein [Hwanghaeella sp. 1Z406]|jgi:hypothetical protein|uniref:hypothetical protein n=1 Tax=Hwanghaeella sp. 1Z406 TaxID=3402811 RepID=UPI0026B8DF26
MRLIDLYVLIAVSLDLARERYQRMGFTVTPNGVHPFGTYMVVFPSERRIISQ